MASLSSSLLPILCFFLILFSSFINAQTPCSSYTFSSNKTFSSCFNLPVLNSILHWTYTPSNRTIELAYRAINITTPTWISWAINPTSKSMVGAQALVAFKNNLGLMHAYTSPVTSYRTSLGHGSLSFPVYDLSANLEGQEMIIFAKLGLPGNTSIVNHIWQKGPMNGDAPTIHATSGANMESFGVLDFSSGKVSNGGGARDSKRTKRNVHGILCTVTWGIMMPTGVIVARYLKVFKSKSPAWFHIHLVCQISAYLIGVGGWGLGLFLGNKSGVHHNIHRNTGIGLFCLGTLQAFAMILRPNPNHKYRIYWNIYHRLTGYTVISLSIFNIFRGFDILDPEQIWKKTYIGIISTLGGIAFALEALTWTMVLLQKQAEKKNATNTLQQ